MSSHGRLVVLVELGYGSLVCLDMMHGSHVEPFALRDVSRGRCFNDVACADFLKGQAFNEHVYIVR